eukprot:TRINITY_DN10012_c2_g1_i1.p1 TRINITY_DN10012_c2_g1~~TRINITY_DN10012_c2_g1_i1.p1  ORF type:complete len:143 (-),score=20.63 TRINITY_DN10012_c2_g1_i1:27-455(-)
MAFNEREPACCEWASQLPGEKKNRTRTKKKIIITPTTNGTKDAVGRKKGWKGERGGSINTQLPFKGFFLLTAHVNYTLLPPPPRFLFCKHTLFERHSSSKKKEKKKPHTPPLLIGIIRKELESSRKKKKKKEIGKEGEKDLA